MANSKSGDKKESKYARYERKQKERGYIKIHPWIPAQDEAVVKSYIEKKRKAHEKAKK